MIRAAYLALMRNYHPDRDGSAEAAARARAITEAYRTIGNSARRAEYDASRRAYQFDILGYEDEAELRSLRKAPVIQWPRAPVIGAVAASALVIVIAVMVLPTTERGRVDTPLPQTTVSPAGNAVATEEAGAALVRTREHKRPSELVVSLVSSKTMETIPTAAPTVRTLPEKGLGTRSKPVRAIENRPVPAKVAVPPEPKRIDVSPSPSAARPAPPKPAPVDEKARVAALQSWSTSFYNQSVSHADEVRRSQLQQARDLFVNTRNACRSDSCVGDAHASYISNISRIMTKPK